MTEAEVRQIVRQMILDNRINSNEKVSPTQQRGDIKMNASTPFGEFAQAYVETYKCNTVRDATIIGLKSTLKVVQGSSFNNMPIGEITLLDGQALVNEWANKQLRLGTIKTYMVRIKSVLNFAVENNIIPRNPLMKIKYPVKSKITPARDVEAYTEEEQSKIEAVLLRKDYMATPIIRFILAEGTRIGETLALTKDRIDLESNTIFIDRTIALDKDHHEFVQDYPKTDSSIRRIPLAPSIKPMVMQLMENADADGFIFCGKKTHRRTTENTALASIAYICKNAGVPYKGSHVFRHTFATNAYRNGADIKSLSKMLGHANVQITYDTYINLFNDGLEDMRAFVK